MEYMEQTAVYSTTFYLSFGTGNSTLGLKVMNKDKEEGKMYKIAMTKQNEVISKIAIYNEEKGQRFFFGTYENSNMVTSEKFSIRANPVDPNGKEYLGFWVRL